MKILVTGDTGLIGSALCSKLVETGEDVYGISTSIKDCNYRHYGLNLITDNIKELVGDINPDIIVHLAAITKVKYSSSDVTMMNAFVTHKLLDAAPKHTKFIFASSGTVYGQHKTERNIRHTPNPSSIYGLSKLYCEDLIRLYTESYKLIDSYVILRYVAHIGNMARHGVVYDIIRKLEGDSEYLELIGDYPGSIKPYIHVDDSIDCTIFAMRLNNITLNVSTKGNISIDNIAKTIMKELNITKPIKWLGKQGDWIGDDKYVDISPNLSCRPSEKAIVDYVRKYKEENNTNRF